MLSTSLFFSTTHRSDLCIEHIEFRGSGVLNDAMLRDEQLISSDLTSPAEEKEASSSGGGTAALLPAARGEGPLFKALSIAQLF